MEGGRAWVRHWPVFTAGGFLLLGVYFGPLLLLPLRPSPHTELLLLPLGRLKITLSTPSWQLFLIHIPTMAVGFLFHTGLLLAGAEALRGHPVSFRLLFRPFWYRPLGTLAAGALRLIYSVLGLVLLVLPGLAAYLRFLFAPLLVQMSSEPFRKVWRWNEVTLGHRFKLLGLLLLLHFLSDVVPSVLLESVAPYSQSAALALGVLLVVFWTGCSAAVLAAAFQWLMTTDSLGILLREQLLSGPLTAEPGKRGVIWSAVCACGVAALVAALALRPSPSSLLNFAFPEPAPPTYGAIQRLGMATPLDLAPVPGTPLIGILSESGLELRNAWGELVSRYPFADPVYSGGMAFSPAGDLCLIWGWKKTFMLDLCQGKERWHTRPCAAAAFSPNANEVALLMGEEILFLEAHTGQPLGAVAFPYRKGAEAWMSYSPCGRKLVVVQQGQPSSVIHTHFVERETGRIKPEDDMGFWGAYYLFTPGGQLIALDGVTLRGLDAAREKVLYKLRSEEAIPGVRLFVDFKAAISADGRYVLSHTDQKMHLWDLHLQRHLGSVLFVEQHPPFRSSLRVDLGPIPLRIPWVTSERGGWIVVSSSRKAFFLEGPLLVGWTGIDSVKIWSIPALQLVVQWYVPKFHPYPLLVWSPRGDCLVFGRAIYRRTPAGWRPLGALPRELNAAAFSHDGALFAFASKREVEIWDAENWQERAIDVLDYDGFVSGLVFPIDRRRLVVARETQKVVQVYETDVRFERKKLLLEIPGARAVRFSPKGHFLAEKTDGGLRLWSLPEAKEALTLTLSFQDLAFCGEESRLAVLCADGTLIALETHTGQEIWRRRIVQDALETGRCDPEGCPPRGARPKLGPIAFSPCGKRIALQKDDEILLLDAESGEVQAAFAAPSLRSLVFSPCGDYLAGVEQDNSALIWNLNPILRVGASEGNPE